jgi:class 3 adenylate cyclase
MTTTAFAPSPVKSNPPARTGPSAGCVLIVDDEEHNRTLLRDPLEAQGYKILEVDGGEDALDATAKHHPDVILLDVMMPRLDGFEVCRRIKRNPAHAHIPILMVTALSERSERLTGIQCGANDFLTKPVDFQDVILRVGNAMHTKRLFDELQREREKSERLLLNTLPQSICARIKNGETNIADTHADVSVLFADLVGFTSLATVVAPEQMVSWLNEIFTQFDELAHDLGLEKIKTVGDAYLVAAGVPTARADHAEALAALALAMQAEIGRINSDYGTSLRLRIGISSGPVVAGVIGRMKLSYDVWGETVNTAHQLEATATPGRIQVSSPTFLKLADGFNLERRTDGDDSAASPSYWLIGRK